MFATRTLRAFVEDEAEKAEAAAEVAVDAALWDGDAMRDAKKRARAEEFWFGCGRAAFRAGRVRRGAGASRRPRARSPGAFRRQ